MLQVDMIVIAGKMEEKWGEAEKTDLTRFWRDGSVLAATQWRSVCLARGSSTGLATSTAVMPVAPRGRQPLGLDRLGINLRVEADDGDHGLCCLPFFRQARSTT